MKSGSSHTSLTSHRQTSFYLTVSTPKLPNFHRNTQKTVNGEFLSLKKSRYRGPWGGGLDENTHVGLLGVLLPTSVTFTVTEG